MSFEPRKYQEITEDMEARVTGLTDFEVGSVTRTLVETFSYELGLLYEKMRLVYLSAFIDTAEGTNLDKVVAILGITRGLPDYSTGLVTFERDKGNNDIVVPLGTLIATEDSPGKPKKVYQTIEEKTLSASASTIDIKIQALERGEEQDAKAGDIIVMPRPLPGIKGVVNRADVRLTGKLREQDAELRERSKNALISAGKATILSIENTLLSQPEVLDVKVREDFLLPQGPATITRTEGYVPDITIPRFTQLKATIDSKTVMLRTKSEVFVKAGLNESQVNLQAEIEGKAGELSTAQVASSWQFVKPEFNAKATIGNIQPIVLSEFGVIDVFVDGPDLSKSEEKARISNAIDRVKAAGIYIRLEGARSVYFDGIFSVDADTRQNFNPEELADLEYRTGEAIRYFLNQTKMGETLLFSKMMREVLTVEGVDNLASFEIFTEAIRYDGVRKRFELGDNKIENEESERFKARDICVAAGEKALPIDVEIQVNGLTDPLFTTLRDNLDRYTGSLEVGAPFINSELLVELKNGVTGIQDGSLKLKPHPWMERGYIFLTDDTPEKNSTGVNVSFVEKATSGTLFAYSAFLEITGAIAIGLGQNVPFANAQNLKVKAMDAVNLYLNNLGPEEDVDLDALTAAAGGVEGIATAEWNPHDFRVEKLLGTTRTREPDRMADSMVEVSQYEKLRLRQNAFCIAFRTEQVTIEITSVKLRLQAEVGDKNILDELSTLTANILNNFLNTAKQGDDLDFNAIRASIENRLPAAPAIVEVLTIKATSAADGREQIISISDPQPIHIRSVELARMTPLIASNLELLNPS